jgi:hypothetical protein
MGGWVEVSHLLLWHGRGKIVVSTAVACRGVGESYPYCCGMARVGVSYFPLLWDGGGSGYSTYTAVAC